LGYQSAEGHREKLDKLNAMQFSTFNGDSQKKKKNSLSLQVLNDYV